MKSVKVLTQDRMKKKSGILDDTGVNGAKVRRKKYLERDNLGIKLFAWYCYEYSIYHCRK